MASTTPGRNDPCPCGSGRKYKACHLRTDEQRDRTVRTERSERTSALAARLSRHFEPVAATLEALHAGRLDERRLAAARGLLRAGEPLETLRFPDELFARIALTDDAWRDWEGAAALLVPDIDDQRDAWLLRLLERLEQTDGTAREPLVTAIAVLLSGRRLPRLRPHEQPLFAEVFLEQRAAVRGEVVDHPAASASDDAAAEPIEVLRAALTGEAPPPLLTLDSWLWLDGALERLLVLPAAERSAGMAAVVRTLGDLFGSALRDRAARLALSSRLSAAARSQARTIARAWDTAPARLVLALLQSRTRKVLWRSSEEQQLFAELSLRATPEGRARYETWLKAHGEEEAAERLHTPGYPHDA